MNRRLNFLIACLTVGMMTVAGLAQIPAPEPDEPMPVAKLPDAASGRVLKKILRMFEGDKTALVEDDFSANFLRQVPFEQLREIVAQIRAAEGSLTFKSLEPGASARGLVANVVGSTNRTSLQVFLGLDANEKIEGLLIRPTAPESREPDVKSWEDFTARLGELAEKSACAVRELVEGEPIQRAPEPNPPGRVITQHTVVERGGSEPLAIGSAFKLWVLGALARQVQAEEMEWDDPLRIQNAIKSLPSGTMQDEREGKEFPIRLFAEKMISISDNTATDHLIHLVGREACEKFMRGICVAPDKNVPFLTTRDLFVLKLSGEELPLKYLAGDLAERRAMLAPEGAVATGTPQLVLAAAWKAPRYIHRLEWFASPRELCSTLTQLHMMSGEDRLTPIRAILSKNPGVPIDKKIFPYIAFKGGSEPGVMCLNWHLERKDGRRFVVSLILNDTKKAIDEKKAVALAIRGLEFLAEWDVPAEKK